MRPATILRTVSGKGIVREPWIAGMNLETSTLVGSGVADKAIDIRVSVLPVVHGERIVMRILDKSKSFRELEDLGFSERDLKVVLEKIESPNGILYVTGPTGSGKTSTLYSILKRLNQPDVNIIEIMAIVIILPIFTKLISILYE